MWSKNFEAFIPKKLHSPKHNLENATIALEVCASFLVSLPLSKIGETLETFKTIPHRFETFATRRGVSFIDDSKATNMHATLSALASLEKKTLLLLGGLSKGESFKQVVSFKEKLPKIVRFGKASATIKKELGGEILVFSFKILIYSNFRFSVRQSSTILCGIHLDFLSQVYLSLKCYRCWET